MIASYRILVAAETDATRYYGPEASRPRMLERSAAEQLLSHLAADLGTLLPGIEKCRVTAPGALFDQTQILRPAFAAFTVLEQRLQKADSGREAVRLSVAAEDGRMVDPALQPDPAIALGPLQLLPIVIDGPQEHITRLGAEMEHRFLSEGQVSAHTAKWLEAAFGIAIRHARFMTLNDLIALFRLQLEHFGFLPLWNLVDAAWRAARDVVDVHPPGGPAMAWRDGAVHCAFETFDFWARQGGGHDTAAGRGSLAGGYAGWTRIMRQYRTTLEAHHVPVAFHLPGQPGQPLKGEYHVEASDHRPAGGAASITQHSFADLGTVCVSVVHNGRQLNFYPLSSRGLHDMQAAIRAAAGDDQTLAFPGTLLHDSVSRVLVPEPVPAGSAR